MAISRNVLFYQGSNGVIRTSLTDASENAVDLSFFTITAKAKKHHGSQNTYVFFTEGYSNGIISCSLTAEETANMDAGRYVYDIEVTENSSNAITRIQHGLLIIKPNV